MLLFVGRRFWRLLRHHRRLLDLLDGSILCSEWFLALDGRQRWRFRSALFVRAAISLLGILRGIHLVYELLQFLIYLLLKELSSLVPLGLWRQVVHIELAVGDFAAFVGDESDLDCSVEQVLARVV